MHIIDPNLPREAMEEYLRRTQLHAAACGANANAITARSRILDLKKYPIWLVNLLDGIIDRTGRVASEMAKHRDEITVYIKEKKP